MSKWSIWMPASIEFATGVLRSALCIQHTEEQPVIDIKVICKNKSPAAISHPPRKSGSKPQETAG